MDLCLTHIKGMGEHPLGGQCRAPLAGSADTIVLVDGSHVIALTPSLRILTSWPEERPVLSTATWRGPHFKTPAYMALLSSPFTPIPKKGNAKECSNYHTVALILNTSKVMLKILQARLQQYVN